MERTLGVNLIDRSTRPLQTTELGKVYYRGCKKMLDEYTDLEASIRQEGERMEVSVQVAAIYSVGLRDMGQYVDRIRRSYRNAEVHIDYLHPDRVYRRVLEGTADLGLVSFPRNTRELTTRPWRDEPMVLVCPPGHRLSNLTRVHPGDLAKESYIGFEKGLVIRREVDRFLREQGVAVNVVLEFDNIENIKEAVEVGGRGGPVARTHVDAGSPVGNARCGAPGRAGHGPAPGSHHSAPRPFESGRPPLHGPPEKLREPQRQGPLRKAGRW